MSHWRAIGYLLKYIDHDKQLTLPVDFGNGVQLIEVPEWARGQKEIEYLSWPKRLAVQKRSRLAFFTEYEADALDSPMQKSKKGERESYQEYAEQRFAFAYLALWIIRPSKISLEVITHYQQIDGIYTFRSSISQDGFRVHKHDMNNLLFTDGLNEAKIINEALFPLPRNSTIVKATKLIFSALCDRYWVTRYVLNWIAMEALFGSESPQETTFRLSQRAAFFLAETRDQARALFDEIKDGYSWRSKAVHGQRLHKLKGEESLVLSYKLQEYLRKALRRILNDPDLIQTFNGKGREEYLDSLIFQ